MNQLQVFNFNQSDLRTIVKNGEPWFVAKDVCDILHHSNSRVALSRLDDDEKGVTKVYTLGGQQNMNIVNEYGLYNLVLTSNLPEAKEFKRWITHEVIPSIRKHGAYMTPEKIEEVLLNPDTIINLATQLKGERQKRIVAELTVEQQKPKVLFADSVSAASTSILIGDLAKVLKQNGIDIGQNRLFSWLREKGYLIRQKGTSYNMPTQKSMDLGLFEIKETVITHSSGYTTISKTPKVTGKGQVYFVNKFLSLKENNVSTAVQ